MEARGARAPIRRQDYKAPEWLVDKTELTIKIFDDHARVSVVLSPSRNPDADETAPLFLHGRELTFVSADTASGPLPDSAVNLQKDGLVIGGLKTGDTLTVTSLCDPFSNTALEGL